MTVVPQNWRTITSTFFSIVLHYFTDDLSDFYALAKKAAFSAVLAVKEGSKEVRDALFNLIVALHSSHDDINETTRDILHKIMSKRSTDGKLEPFVFSRLFSKGGGKASRSGDQSSLETGLFEVVKMVDETFRRRYAKVGADTG